MRDIVCECGATVTVHTADSINGERHPHMRQAVLDRTLHTFDCGACEKKIVVEKQFLYVDLERKQFYGVFPDADRGDEKRCANELVTAWNHALGDQAPLSVRA